MSEYLLVKRESLILLADVLREVAGTSENLIFPDEYISLARTLAPVQSETMEET